jgi:hypothetical protein
MKDIKEVLKLGLLVLVISVVLAALLFWVDQNRTQETANEQAVHPQEYVHPDEMTLQSPYSAFPWSGSRWSFEVPYRQSLPGLAPLVPYSIRIPHELSDRVPMIYRGYPYHSFQNGQMARSGVQAPENADRLSF